MLIWNEYITRSIIVSIKKLFFRDFCSCVIEREPMYANVSYLVRSFRFYEHVMYN